MLLADDGRDRGVGERRLRRGRHRRLPRGGACLRHAALVRFGVTDEQAWDVGLACGGTIDVLVQPSVPRAARDAARSGRGKRARARAGRRRARGHAPARRAAGCRDEQRSMPVPTAPMADAGGRPRRRPCRWLSGHPAGPRRDRGRRRLACWRAADGRHPARPLDDARARRPRSSSSRSSPSARASSSSAACPSPRRSHASRASSATRSSSSTARPAFATRERFPDVDGLIVGWPDEVADEIGAGPG